MWFPKAKIPHHDKKTVMSMCHYQTPVITKMSPSQLLLVCVGVSLRVKSDRPSLAWIESTLNLTLDFTFGQHKLYNDSTVTLMAYDLTTDPMYKM